MLYIIVFVVGIYVGVTIMSWMSGEQYEKGYSDGVRKSEFSKNH